MVLVVLAGAGAGAGTGTSAFAALAMLVYEGGFGGSSFDPPSWKGVGGAGLGSFFR